MFYLLPLELDQERTANYRKYQSETPSFLDHKAYLAIPPQKQEQYLTNLEHLFNKYKVKEEHLEYLLYIIGQHFFIYQTIIEKKADADECYGPLKFLQSYQLQTQSIIKLSKDESAFKSKLNNRYIEVISPDYKADTPITLSNADFVVKAIYQLIKNRYSFSLKQLLINYEDIPPIDIINNLLNEVEYIINHATHYLVAEIAEDLLDYMSRYMIGELSRKQYLFIFDLLLISNVFSLVNDEESQSFNSDISFFLNEVEETTKTAYLKRMIKNYRKFTKNHL